MTHKKFGSSSTRGKGKRKGFEIMRATAPGAVRVVSPKKFPVSPKGRAAATKQAKRASLLSGVKGRVGGVTGGVRKHRKRSTTYD